MIFFGQRPLFSGIVLLKVVASFQIENLFTAGNVELRLNSLHHLNSGEFVEMHLLAVVGG